MTQRSEREVLEEELRSRNQKLTEIVDAKARSAEGSPITGPVSAGPMKFAKGGGGGVVTITDGPRSTSAGPQVRVFAAGETPNPKAAACGVQAYHGVIFGRQVVGSISSNAAGVTGSPTQQSGGLGPDCVVVPWRLVE